MEKRTTKLKTRRKYKKMKWTYKRRDGNMDSRRNVLSADVGARPPAAAGGVRSRGLLTRRSPHRLMITTLTPSSERGPYVNASGSTTQPPAIATSQTSSPVRGCSNGDIQLKRRGSTDSLCCAN
ncbi:hypothetical protein V5799_017470 [Amblyomma americanum]|uniref:Uncharacterized protein n=1 Tax=Amblyomma americanum TaxID=6943 RepID=A0AAQ4F2F0_AMBAM